MFKSDTMVMELHIINRFGHNTHYPLGEALQQNGVTTYHCNLTDFTIRTDGTIFCGEKILDTPQTFLWRLSENIYPATKTLARQLENLGHTLINPSLALSVCGDKQKTHDLLNLHAIPVVPTNPIFPNTVIPEGFIVKPARGAQGRDVYVGDGILRVQPDSMEAWILQPYAGESKDFIRVLVVNNQIVEAYKWVSNERTFVNNVEAESIRQPILITEEIKIIALDAARICGTIIAEVDLTAEPYRVLEVNSTPDIQPEHMPETARLLKKYLQTAENFSLNA